MSLCNGGHWYISSTSVNVGKQLIQFYIVCYLTVEISWKCNWKIIELIRKTTSLEKLTTVEAVKNKTLFETRK